MRLMTTKPGDLLKAWQKQPNEALRALILAHDEREPLEALRHLEQQKTAVVIERLDAFKGAKAKDPRLTRALRDDEREVDGIRSDKEQRGAHGARKQRRNKCVENRGDGDAAYGGERMLTREGADDGDKKHLREEQRARGVCDQKARSNVAGSAVSFGAETRGVRHF